MASSCPGVGRDGFYYTRLKIKPRDLDLSFRDMFPKNIFFARFEDVMSIVKHVPCSKNT